MKKPALAVISLLVLQLIVTGCMTNIGQAKPKTQQDEKTNPVVSSNNQLEQVAVSPSTDTIPSVYGGKVDFASHYDSVESLVNKSTLIVQAKVISLDYFDFNTHTFTKAKVRVLNSYNDKVKAGDVVTFVDTGGITTMDKLKLNSGGEGKPGATPITEKDKNTKVQVLFDGCPLLKLNDELFIFGVEDKEDFYKLSEQYYGIIGSYQGKFVVKGDSVERYSNGDISPLKMSKLDIDERIRNTLKK